MVGERITLALPGELRFIGVVRRFVGGVATRADLGYETVDDLQLALESILRTSLPGGDITVEASLDGQALSVRVGPFSQDPLRPDESHPDTIELERLLSALVAGVESVDEPDGCWLRLDVRIPTGSGSA